MPVKPHRSFLLSTAILACLALLLLTACSAAEPPTQAGPPRLQGIDPSKVAAPAATAVTSVAPPAPTVTPVPATATPTESPTPSPTFTATPTQSVRFAVIGDYGAAGDAERAVAELVISWHPEIILTTGDNNYPNGEAATIDDNIGQYYHEYISSYAGSYGAGAGQNRFFPTLGNHDWNTAGASPYLEYFSLPGNERYYDFTWGPVHFFALDSDSREPDGFRRDSLQADWLQAQLAASTSPWDLVIMHHPPYSSGLHGSVTWMRWPFEEWGADAVLSGHDHVYERLQLGGLPYFINGLGGGAIYHFDQIDPASQARFNADYGAMLVEANETSIVFQFITRTGEVIDTFSLQKGP